MLKYPAKAEAKEILLRRASKIGDKTTVQKLLIENNCAADNKITLTLGNYYSFTLHSKHGKDKMDFVDKAVIQHFKKMLNTFGIEKSNFWELVKKYSTNTNTTKAAFIAKDTNFKL